MSPLTPQEQVVIDKLDNDLQHTPTIQDIKENQELLITGQKNINSSLEKELLAQDVFKNYVQKEFNKGSDKFDKFETRMDEIEDKMDKGLDKIANSQTALANEIKDKKIEDLTKQIDKQNDKKSNIANGIIVGLTLLLIGAFVTIATNVISDKQAVQIAK